MFANTAALELIRTLICGRRMLGTGVVLIMLLSHCPGQQIHRYRPGSPTVSPYLNLSRVNDSGLPNYFSLVRPQQRQRALEQQQRELQRQQQIQQVRGEIQQRTLASPTGKAGWFMNPGTKTAFQNTSNYFPRVNIGR